jgi:hypothetical protein
MHDRRRRAAYLPSPRRRVRRVVAELGLSERLLACQVPTHPLCPSLLFACRCVVDSWTRLEIRYRLWRAVLTRPVGGAGPALLRLTLTGEASIGWGNGGNGGAG